MAFSNLIVDSSLTAAPHEGGTDGTSEVNADLASPLLLQGTHCRFYSTTSQAGGIVHTLLNKVSNTDFPSLYQTPATKIIRLEAWVRLAWTAFTSSETYVWLGVKTGPVVAGNWPGYFFGFGYNAAAGFTGSWIEFVRKDTGTIGLSHNGDVTGLSANVWYQIRMEVEQVGADDEVRCYWNTGTEAAPVWTLIRSVTVSPVAAYYIPWQDATHGFMGYKVRQRTSQIAQVNSAWIDRFSASLKDK